MVMMNLGGANTSGWVTGQIYHYPFNYHMDANLFVVISAWIVYRIQPVKIEIRKYCYLGLVVLSFLAFLKSDLIYAIAFVAPLTIVTILSFMKKNLVPKIPVILMVTLGGIIVLRLMCLIVPQLSMLFATETSKYSFSTNMYGMSNWTSIGVWGSQLQIYLTIIANLFNFNFAQISVINLDIVVYTLRLLLVIYMFYNIIRNVVRIFSKKESNDAETLISLGFVLLSIVFICSEVCENTYSGRYLGSLLILGTVVLCWNIDKIYARLLDSRMHCKIGWTFMLLCLMVAASYQHEWGCHKANDLWDDSHEQAVEIAEERGLTDGLASIFIAYDIGAVSDMAVNCVAASYGENNGFVLGVNKGDSIYQFVIVENGKGVGGSDGWNSIVTPEQLLQAYGEPDEIVELPCYDMWIYQTNPIVIK